MLVFMSAVVYSVVGLGIGLPTCNTSVQPFTQGSLVERSPGRYEVQYVARMWAFEPATIEVPAGSTLDIYLTSVDVVHGFEVLGTNLNLMAVPGAVNNMQLTLKEPGEYRIICHEYCGIMHQNMNAVIKVTRS